MSERADTVRGSRLSYRVAIMSWRDQQFASNIGRDGTLIVRGLSNNLQRSCKDRVFPALLR